MHSLHSPVKSVSDPLRGKHVPCYSADHEKGGVPEETSAEIDPGKGQGKWGRRLYLADS